MGRISRQQHRRLLLLALPLLAIIAVVMYHKTPPINRLFPPFYDLLPVYAVSSIPHSTAGRDSRGDGASASASVNVQLPSVPDVVIPPNQLPSNRPDTSINNANTHKDKIVPTSGVNKIAFIPRDPPTPDSDVTILLWTNTSYSRVAMQARSTEFKSLEGKTCRVVFDRALYNESEAVIFHIEEHQHIADYPAYQMSFQKWVLLEDEAPPQTDKSWPREHVLDHIKRNFNVTSTIARSSTVQLAGIYNISFDSQRYAELKETSVNYHAYKSRGVAWFVSHCETQSRREDYVRELQKYIDVDIYGTCGNLTCADKVLGRGGACDMDLLDRNYKFYLSFESSFCEDYVTEKLWRFIYQPVTTIPVVMGYVNYTDILPDGTVIDVSDYATPKHLAEYLKHVASQPDIYNEYIKKRLSVVWRERFGVAYRRRLCSFLHARRNEVVMIPDLAEEWSQRSRCIKPWEYMPADFWSRDPYP